MRTAWKTLQRGWRSWKERERMTHDLGNLERRLAQLERKSGGDIFFTMSDGTVESMRRRYILAALDDAINKRSCRNTRLFLTAVEVHGAGNLHELARALAGGPVGPEV
jgi:hypothetical protein